MEIAAARAQQGSLDRAARRFMGLLGFVSLFGNMTYEGARSIIGPYLATLGASATVVGIAAGFEELVGHTLRLGLCPSTHSTAACFACFAHSDDEATDAKTKAITSDRAWPRFRLGA
jgi:hypothetical protein